MSKSLSPAACALLASIYPLFLSASYAQEQPGAAETKPASDTASSPASQETNSRSTQTPKAKAEGRSQSAPAVKAKSKDGVQQVVIDASAHNDMEERRLSTASKMIFGRDELDRNGDSTLGEVLKRLPGVTIGGRPGRGGDIRMRGLGSGYTQILVNGERPPRGFSLDSLSPDQVERIEIIRAPVAEFSTQAIAGTINIVLREDYHQKTTDVRVAESLEQGRSAPSISITHPIEAGQLSYALTVNVSQNHQLDDTLTDSYEQNAEGRPSLEQHVRDQTDRISRNLQLAPRFNYRFDNGDTLMVQPFVTTSRSDSSTISHMIQPVGVPEYALADTAADAETTFARGFGNWQHKFDGNAKLVVKFGGGVGKMDNTSLRLQYDGAGKLTDNIVDDSTIRDSSYTVGGKYTKPLGEGHTLAAGADAEQGRRDETKVSLDNGLPRFADSGDNLQASTRRLAAFVQDDFDINEQWAAYAGLRWEGIRTTSTLPGGEVVNTSSVWSPLLHAVWRIPGQKKDQIRMSLTHAYRAPSLNDLIALPSISSLNSPTRPDRIGNPNLKPELSHGLDLAYEHYLSRAGIMSANFFVRDITDLMRRETDLVNTPTGPRWVSAPLNIASATTRGIELEAKFQWQEFFPEGPAVDLRSNYSHFWSNVEGIPGPNNRLDQQPSATANFGLDYRLSRLPLTLGGNYNWTPSYVVQSSETQANSVGVKRQIDLYGLWKFSPAAQLRLAANNLQGDDYLTGTMITTGGINHVDHISARTYTTWTLRLELKL